MKKNRNWFVLPPYQFRIFLYVGCLMIFYITVSVQSLCERNDY